MTTAQSQAIDLILLKHEVEDFFSTEAELLDDWRYDEWLKLVTEDVRYWMPIRRNFKFGEQWRENTKELEGVAWFDDNKNVLTLRVQQLMTGIHWAEEPLSRMTHLVANVHIVDVKPSLVSPSEVSTKCRFVVYRNRLDYQTDFFIGKREDVLRKVEGEWKLARRNIFLDQSVLLAKNLTFLF